jgi:hypothetical protein
MRYQKPVTRRMTEITSGCGSGGQNGPRVCNMGAGL